MRIAVGVSCCLLVGLVALGSTQAFAEQLAYDTAADEYTGVLIGETKSDYLTSPSDADPHGALIADLNGDGYGDVIVGAPRYGSNGRIYVRFGAEDLSGETDLASGVDFTVTGSSTSSNISAAMAAGDINGDGIADLVIGAPSSESLSGAVYIVFGSVSLSGDLDLGSTSADVVITGPSGLAMLGNDVAIGDVNGDGVGDLVIGSPYFDVPVGDGSTLDYAGAVYVLFGSSSWSGSIDLTVTPADVMIYGNNEDGWDSHVGSRVGVGNFDGDAYDDIVFGHCQADVDGWDDEGYPGYSGIYWAIMGSGSLSASYSMGDGDYDFKVWGTGWEGSGTSAYNIGEELGIGDLDGDGYDDLILSTISYGGAPTALRVVPGGSGFSGTQGNIEDLSTATFNFASGNEGYGGIAVGDFNGSLTEDLAIGNPFGTPDSRWWAGEAYIFLGGAEVMDTHDVEADADIVIWGEVAGDYLGQQLGAGDIDGDGRSDLVVGAANADYGSRSGAGMAYYFFGSAIAPTSGGVDVPVAGPIALLGLGLLLSYSGVRRLMRRSS